MKVELFDYNTKAWVGETISKDMRRYQNAKCFNCGRKGYLRRDFKKRVPRHKVSFGNYKNRSKFSNFWIM